MGQWVHLKDDFIFAGVQIYQVGLQNLMIQAAQGDPERSAETLSIIKRKGALVIVLVIRVILQLFWILRW